MPEGKFAKPQWFYRKNGIEIGPLTAGDLKSLAKKGDLQPQDLIWREGLAKWVPASSASGLFTPMPANIPKPAPIPAPLLATLGIPEKVPEPVPASKSKISPAFKKICARCGKDITFAKRSRGGDGMQYCLDCVDTQLPREGELVTCNRCGGSFSAESTRDYFGEIVCKNCPDERTARPPAILTGNTTTLLNPTSKGRASRKWLAPLIIALGIIIISVFIVSTPTSNRGVAHSTPQSDASNAPATSFPPANSLSPDSILSNRQNPSIPQVHSPALTVRPPIPTVLFNQTIAYRNLRDAAISRLSKMDSDLIGEDSSYRAISQTDAACRDMLAIWIRVEANDSQAADTATDAVQLSTNRLVDVEDSAIRAIDENDVGFFNLLGTYCDVLAKKYPQLQNEYAGERNSVTSSTIGEDSAIRDSAAYTDASLKIFAAIVRQSGHSAEVDKIISDVGSETVTEDSSWRVATANSRGILRLLLVSLRERNGDAARTISAWTDSQVAAADTTLQERQAYNQAIAKVLQGLISSPNQ